MDIDLIKELDNMDNINFLFKNKYLLVDRFVVKLIRSTKNVQDVLIIKNILLLMKLSNALPRDNKTITIGDLFSVSLMRSDVLEEYRRRKKVEAELRKKEYLEIMERIPPTVWDDYSNMTIKAIAKKYDVVISTASNWVKFIRKHLEDESSF